MDEVAAAHAFIGDRMTGGVFDCRHSLTPRAGDIRAGSARTPP
jgi:hypothetical protein